MMTTSLVKPNKNSFFCIHQILLGETHWDDCMPTRKARSNNEKYSNKNTQRIILSIVNDEVRSVILIDC